MMRIGALIAIGLGLAAGCGKSDNVELRKEMARQHAAAAEEQKAAAERAAAAAAKPAPADAAVAAAPEPTTPEEIETARKQAMIDGRDRDVLKYCEAGNVDPAKSDPQVLLGCALAACRIGDADRARGYAKGLTHGKQGKALMEQARKTCLANKVAL